MPDQQTENKGQPGIVSAALFALCPKCGAKGLFAGLVNFAPKCGNCGLDYTKFNVGDGAAAFLTMIIGALSISLAMWVEFTWEPPVWVHVVLWVPFITGGVIWGLRVAKAVLLAAEYKTKAGEGRLAE
jgi:uncharacterized protein (DUF983 family)